ncbi:unnamed protein product, partial [Effrenium voratum]
VCSMLGPAAQSACEPDGLMDCFEIGPCWSQRWLRAMDRQCPELAAWARRLNAE